MHPRTGERPQSSCSAFPVSTLLPPSVATPQDQVHTHCTPWPPDPCSPPHPHCPPLPTWALIHARMLAFPMDPWAVPLSLCTCCSLPACFSTWRHSSCITSSRKPPGRSWGSFSGWHSDPFPSIDGSHAAPPGARTSSGLSGLPTPSPEPHTGILSSLGGCCWRLQIALSPPQPAAQDMRREWQWG